MAFSSGSGGGPMADINVTPLVDVMLVLLIIFMVTAPPISHQIQVDLPQPTVNPPPPPPNPPDPVKIRIEASGTVMMNGTPIDMRSLEAQFNAMSELEEDRQGKLEIDTDPEAEYEVLAKVLARAKNADLKKIGFVKAGG
ncbi:MAG TPA: biopolymer transporter ExbD [Arenimonas sp.]|nr:biopolymer transporter ExbD [Arenimonas sp.]HOZ06100.1 biopolymer transporter ExbD [Arenimonas sp.]HPO24212.1 biopolymer transporter ExbD [Arenimonas sp.]HPW32412.1 biopolymer transporter ExbD [Arenimonas sp.]